MLRLRGTIPVSQPADLITTHHRRIGRRSTARPGVNGCQLKQRWILFASLTASVRLDDDDNAVAAVKYLWLCAGWPRRSLVKRRCLILPRSYDRGWRPSRHRRHRWPGMRITPCNFGFCVVCTVCIRFLYNTCNPTVPFRAGTVVQSECSGVSPFPRQRHGVQE